MSYCLSKQVLEVDDFLRTYEQHQDDRRRILLAAYPWIPQIASNLEDFLSYEPSAASLKIVGHLTGVSKSFLEKMGLRSSR